MILFLNFCGKKSSFGGATGALCFRIWLTLPMGFKARVDAPLPALFSHSCIMSLKVNPDYQTGEWANNLSHTKQEFYYFDLLAGVTGKPVPKVWFGIHKS